MSRTDDVLLQDESCKRRVSSETEAASAPAGSDELEFEGVPVTTPAAA